jgi:hypothetical protein
VQFPDHEVAVAAVAKLGIGGIAAQTHHPRQPVAQPCEGNIAHEAGGGVGENKGHRRRLQIGGGMLNRNVQ